jgi:hypothetical protein
LVAVALLAAFLPLFLWQRRHCARKRAEPGHEGAPIKRGAGYYVAWWRL